MENWKDIIGFEGLYQISDLGNVRSIRKNIIMKPKQDEQGYYRITLKNKLYLIHRLVGIHFIPNPLNKRTINHLNGVKTDNTINNLEWATDAENIKHAVDTGLINQKGSKNANSRLSESDIIYIRESTLTPTKLAGIFGIHRTYIHKIRNKEKWKHLN